MSDILEVKNITKKYAKFTLQDFSFSIPEGSIVGFIGRNGAGKTTTLKGIMNLIHFDSGDVFFMGHNMKNYEMQAKQQIGFTLSELSYFPNKTIAQLVDVIQRFYPKFDETKFNKMCDLFKLDTKKKLEQLSSGMKVKYSLAIALSHDAKLLILDEPTSGLDPISRDEVLDIFKSIVKNKERAILFSTHITSDLDKCATDIIYIKEGVKQYEGSKAEFIDSYYLVEMESSKFIDCLKDDVISYKDFDDKITALIHQDSYEKFANIPSIELTRPDLEEIMIYLERSGDHEEFIL